jgi:hypothetical protein
LSRSAWALAGVSAQLVVPSNAVMKAKGNPEGYTVSS